MIILFFFSSRRRHTRCGRDWSSDVCSSDLRERRPGAGLVQAGQARGARGGDQASGTASDRRAEGLPDRHSHPLGLRRHQHWSALARQRAHAVRRRRQRAHAGVQGVPRQHREDVMAASGADTTASPWAAHRRRAELLRAHHSFAEEVLTLYLALLDVWEEAGAAAREQEPEAPALAGWAGEHVLPGVVEATVEAGPELLADAIRKRMEDGGAEAALVAWLSGSADDLEPVERYLARASLRGPLEMLEAGADACAQDPSPRGGRRSLLCVRCGASWGYSSNTCASCGETGGARRTIYAERREWPVVGHGHATAPRSRPGAPMPMFPHLRIEGCSSCNRYLIDVDLGHDARAVPEVDELAALPLDLDAAERGLSKITPNLMGF